MTTSLLRDRPAGQQIGLLLLIAVGAAGYMAWDSLVHMAAGWRKPEYNHAYLIPLVAGVLVWQRLPLLARARLAPSWLGFVACLVVVGIIVVGELSGVHAIVQYGVVALLGALVLAALGVRGLVILAAPLAYLVFLVPLPSMVFNNLSQSLQLISSVLGVELMRGLGISVFLEGNVIDLGGYELHVVEACSGLRYLFPLLSFGFLLAVLYRGRPWARVLLVVAALPVTVLMNSLRIGVTGVLVEHRGIGMAEGFQHYFEGWVVFLACLAVLFAVMWLLHRVSGLQGSAWDRVDLALPPLPVADAAHRARSVSMPLVACLAVLLVVAVGSRDFAVREQWLPAREPFHRFPLAHEQWLGRQAYLAPEVVAELDVGDYLSATFSHPRSALPVDLYVAYYPSQRKGASAHSPRSCIPGGGWVIESLARIELDAGPAAVPKPLPANRVIIARGSDRQLVYYWFPQRGRLLTNEYVVKWFLFWDSLTRGRSDGALVRLVVPLPDGVPVAQAEAQLARFVVDFQPELGRFIPG